MDSDVLIQSLAPFLQQEVLLLLLIGVLIGALVGLLPGLGAIVAMALMLPFTFDMSAFEALAFLLAIYAVTTITGDITAILVGVPGTPSSAALVLDGYAMTKQGEAGRALGAAVSSSAIGAVIGAVALAISIPFMRPMVLALGSPEIFMLTVIGVAMVGTLSGKAPIKGMIAGALGFLLAATGPESQAGISRFAFGSSYLLDGIPLIPLAVGMFAIPEIVDLHKFRKSIARRAPGGESRPMEGVRDSLRRWWLVTRCSLIGVGVGAVPGLGGGVAQWMAYGHAVQTSKDPDSFGHGNVDGVLAPGSANNSKEGGGLIPTIAFGIPGTAAMALLLGAFLIVGLQPGPDMVSTNLDVTLFMVWALASANLLGAVLTFAFLPLLAKITFVRGTLLLPFIVVMVFIGSVANSGRFPDLLVALMVGGVSFLLRRYGWPIIPILLGYVLGDRAENSLWITYRIYEWNWLLRPSVIAFALVSLLIILFASRQMGRTGQQPVPDDPASIEGSGAAQLAEVLPADDDIEGDATTTPGAEKAQWLGDVLVGVALLALGVFVVFYAQQWSRPARLFPTGVGAAMALLALVQTVKSWLRRPHPPARQGSVDAGAAPRPTIQEATGPVAVAVKFGQEVGIRRGTGLGILLWLVGLTGLAYVLGFAIGFAVLTAAYLRFEDGMGWLRSLGIGVVTGLSFHLMFTVFLGVRTPSALLEIL